MPIANPIPESLASESPTPAAGRPPYAARFEFLRHQPVRKAGMMAVLAYLFIKFSLLHEFIAAKTGIDTRIVLMASLVAIITALMAGMVPRILSTRIGIFVLLFSGWLILAIPASTWIGGSFSFIMNFYLRTILPIFIAIAVLPVGLANMRSSLLAVGWAAVLASLMGRSFSSMTDGGRTELDFGSIKNSGDLAAFYVVLMPFLFFLFQNVKNWGVRLLIVGLFLSNVQLVLSTAARSALVAFGVAVAFVLIWGGGKLRAFVLVLVCLGSLTAGLFLPASVINRLAALSGKIDSEEAREAEGSKEARRAVAERALTYTLQRPIFGVGPNVFQDYDAGRTLAKGARRAQWQETHNGYLQISVEAGIPALLFKVAALLSAFFFLRRVYLRSRKIPELHVLSSAAFCLMGSLVMVMVFDLFLSQGYAFWTFVLLALSAGLQLALREDPALAVYGRRLGEANYYGNVAFAAPANPANAAGPARMITPAKPSRPLHIPSGAIPSEAPRARLGGRPRILN